MRDQKLDNKDKKQESKTNTLQNVRVDSMQEKPVESAKQEEQKVIYVNDLNCLIQEQKIDKVLEANWDQNVVCIPAEQKSKQNMN